MKMFNKTFDKKCIFRVSVWVFRRNELLDQRYDFIKTTVMVHVASCSFDVWCESEMIEWVSTVFYTKIFPKHVSFHENRTPTLIGCSLVIEKNYFFEMGAFDEGMDIWGGENIELPVRVRNIAAILIYHSSMKAHLSVKYW